MISKRKQKTYKYKCSVLARRAETEEIIEAETGWEARQRKAEKHGVPTIEVIARRIVEGK